MKQPVSRVLRLFGKIKLGGEDAAAGTLDLEMEMAGTAGIEGRHDGVKPPPPLRVGELMTSQPEPHAVVVAVFVRMPDLDEAAGEWPAAIVEHEPGDRNSFATGRLGIKITFERRVRTEERAGLPLEGEIVSIVA